MNYGQLVDNNFKPEREKIYGYFADYFNNPIMTKIKDVNTLSMYAVKAYCLTANSCRYVIVFVPFNYDKINSKRNLIELKWENFQTRTLDNKMNNIDTLSYSPQENGSLMSKINRISIDDNSCSYNCEDYPLTITLLSDNKKNLNSYQSSGNIIIALETWSTICTWN